MLQETSRNHPRRNSHSQHQYLPKDPIGNFTRPTSSRYAPLFYFASFSGTVRPKIEIRPMPATFTFASCGLGKYNTLQVSQRYTSVLDPHAFSMHPHSRSRTSAA